MRSTRRLSGHANPGMEQFKQIATADTTINFYGFTPVGGNATLETLTDVAGNSALTQFDGTTAYQNVYYSGNYSGIKLSAGRALLHLSEQ